MPRRLRRFRLGCRLDDDHLPCLAPPRCPLAGSSPRRGVLGLQAQGFRRIRRGQARRRRTGGVGVSGSARASRRRGAPGRRDQDGERAREQAARGGYGHRPSQSERHREGELHGLDHRRKDVRQLRRATAAGAQGRAHHHGARPCHPRMDRGSTAHGRGREATLLDPAGARLWRQAGSAPGDARVRHRAARLHPGSEAAARRRSGTGGRRQDQGRPGEQGHAEGHGHGSSPAQRRGAGELLDLADRREAPRRVEGQACRTSGDRILGRLGRGRRAHGRRREAHALGAGRAVAAASSRRAARERRHHGRRAHRDPHRSQDARRREGPAQGRDRREGRPGDQGAHQGDGHGAPDARQQRHGELRGMDDGRQDVRLVVLAR